MPSSSGPGVTVFGQAKAVAHQRKSKAGRVWWDARGGFSGRRGINNKRKNARRNAGIAAWKGCATAPGRRLPAATL